MVVSSAMLIQGIRHGPDCVVTLLLPQLTSKAGHDKWHSSWQLELRIKAWLSE
jgi:hypothetical protein